jgi:GTP cyclohydrolase II
MGTFRLHAFRMADGEEHVCLAMGDLDGGRQPVLARVHSQCLTGEALASVRCDCSEQLDQALGAIAAAGRGVVVYLRQEGRGIGLFNKVRAYALQDGGADTVDANLQLGFPADARDYAPAVAILKWLGIDAVRLMTNNPRKIAALEKGGIAVVERIAINGRTLQASAAYLAAKQVRLGHLPPKATRCEVPGRHQAPLLHEPSASEPEPHRARGPRLEFAAPHIACGSPDFKGGKTHGEGTRSLLLGVRPRGAHG